MAGVAVWDRAKGFQADSPVLDQGYHLGVGLPNDALSVHLHYPVPWRVKGHKQESASTLAERLTLNTNERQTHSSNVALAQSAAPGFPNVRTHASAIHLRLIGGSHIGINSRPDQSGTPASVYSAQRSVSIQASSRWASHRKREKRDNCGKMGHVPAPGEKETR